MTQQKTENRKQKTVPPARLVFLLQDLKFGGTQRQTLELARRLDQTRFRAEVWLMMGGEDLAPLARSWGVPLVWLSHGSWVGPTGLLGLWRRLRRQPVDLLMLLTAVPNIWGRILGRMAKAPLIVGNCRSGTDPRNQHLRRLWPWAHHIICNNQDLPGDLTNHYGLPATHLTVIHNGVDPDFFRPAASPNPAAPPVVLSVARLEPVKDHETLVRAFHLLVRDHPDVELWLVGEGSRRPALESLAQSLLPPGKVRFLAGQEDLRPLFAQAALLALSSRNEALPNVVLEAMASGLPVVATGVGGLPEVVVAEETGRLVPPGDAPALAAAISQLLAHPDTRRAFGQAGRERVVRHFSLAAMVRRYEEVLGGLLDGNI